MWRSFFTLTCLLTVVNCQIPKLWSTFPAVPESLQNFKVDVGKLPGKLKFEPEDRWALVHAKAAIRGTTPADGTGSSVDCDSANAVFVRDMSKETILTDRRSFSALNVRIPADDYRLCWWVAKSGQWTAFEHVLTVYGTWNHLVLTNQSPQDNNANSVVFIVSVSGAALSAADKFDFIPAGLAIERTRVAAQQLGVRDQDTIDPCFATFRVEPARGRSVPNQQIVDNAQSVRLAATLGMGIQNGQYLVCYRHATIGEWALVPGDKATAVTVAGLPANIQTNGNANSATTGSTTSSSTSSNTGSGNSSGNNNSGGGASPPSSTPSNLRGAAANDDDESETWIYVLVALLLLLLCILCCVCIGIIYWCCFRPSNKSSKETTVITKRIVHQHQAQPPPPLLEDKEDYKVYSAAPPPKSPPLVYRDAEVQKNELVDMQTETTPPPPEPTPPPPPPPEPPLVEKEEEPKQQAQPPTQQQPPPPPDEDVVAVQTDLSMIQSPRAPGESASEPPRPPAEAPPPKHKKHRHRKHKKKHHHHHRKHPTEQQNAPPPQQQQQQQQPPPQPPKPEMISTGAGPDIVWARDPYYSPSPPSIGGGRGVSPPYSGASSYSSYYSSDSEPPQAVVCVALYPVDDDDYTSSSSSSSSRSSYSSDDYKKKKNDDIDDPDTEHLEDIVEHPPKAAPSPPPPARTLSSGLSSNNEGEYPPPQHVTKTPPPAYDNSGIPWFDTRRPPKYINDQKPQSTINSVVVPIKGDVPSGPPGYAPQSNWHDESQKPPLLKKYPTWSLDQPYHPGRPNPALYTPSASRPNERKVRTPPGVDKTPPRNPLQPPMVPYQYNIYVPPPPPPQYQQQLQQPPPPPVQHHGGPYDQFLRLLPPGREYDHARTDPTLQRLFQENASLQEGIRLMFQRGEQMENKMFNERNQVLELLAYINNTRQIPTDLDQISNDENRRKSRNKNTGVQTSTPPGYTGNNNNPGQNNQNNYNNNNPPGYGGGGSYGGSRSFGDPSGTAGIQRSASLEWI
eukprot:TRINITY_DN66365_c11_g1_i1.p1 TRINITY_DN66365_c11_g1~~TRINITY_DN66365_c11_g1_i1.p1  ORF type:complete len:1016 (+),score=175.47 TRINITY_DN66365_c11_g1_i1:94-3141(+)